MGKIPVNKCGSVEYYHHIGLLFNFFYSFFSPLISQKKGFFFLYLFLYINKKKKNVYACVYMYIYFIYIYICAHAHTFINSLIPKLLVAIYCPPSQSGRGVGEGVNRDGHTHHKQPIILQQSFQVMYLMTALKEYSSSAWRRASNIIKFTWTFSECLNSLITLS